MALGPGKYDAACTKVREETKAMGALVVVLSGHLGDGFSVQVPPELAPLLPVILRAVAQEIEDSFGRA